MQNSRVLCIAWKVYRAVSDESGCNGASTGTNSKGLCIRDARVHRKVDHSYMSAGRSGIMTSEHGHGSQFTSTGRRVVPSIRWWQRVGLVWTVFWIIKYHTYWPDCNSKLNLSTTTWLEGHAQDNNNLQYHLIHSFYKYINTIYSAQYTLLTWKYLLTNCH